VGGFGRTFNRGDIEGAARHVELSSRTSTLWPLFFFFVMPGGSDLDTIFKTERGPSEHVKVRPP